MATLQSDAPASAEAEVVTFVVPAPANPVAGRRRALPRLLGWLGTALSWLLLLVSVAALLGLGVGPRIFGYRTETVLSGSMRPTFAPGDVVVVTPQPARDVHVGEIISYHIPIGDHHVETHRIVRVLSRGAHPVIVTKGDANAGADPWRARLSGNTVWQVRAVVPYLGRAIQFLRSPVAHLLTVIVAPALLALMLLVRIWRPGKPEAAP